MYGFRAKNGFNQMFWLQNIFGSELKAMLFENKEQNPLIGSAMNNQENAPPNNLTYPRCQLSHIQKNGHTYYRKHNYQCRLCDRQFVIRAEIV